MTKSNNMNLTIPQGWECPKCRHVYSPTTSMCIYCPQSITSGTTSSGTTMISGIGEVSTYYRTNIITDHVFRVDTESSSATLCKLCGKEKNLHQLTSIS